MPYIYKTTNIINDKIYIGQTKKTKEFSINYIGSGKLLKEAILEFGKNNFIKEILEDFTELDINLLDEREKYWISYYNSTNPEFGYNTTKGGSGWSSFGLKRNQETKTKQSKKRKGVSPWNKGKKNPYSQDQIQKMLDNRKIKNGYSLKPKYIWKCPLGEFDKRKDVANLYNVTHRMITIWCDDEKNKEFEKIKI